LSLLIIAVVGSGGGWVLRDRSARKQRLTDQVELILQDVDRLEQEQKWPEALAAIERAEAALTSGGVDDAIRRRLSQVQRELAFVARLERVRQDLSSMSEGKTNVGAVRDFPPAFRDYGVDVEALPAEEAVARLRGNPALEVHVAATLDTWAEVLRSRGEAAPKWKLLVAVARGLDPVRVIGFNLPCTESNGNDAA
jgi:hypothetical protein